MRVGFYIEGGEQLAKNLGTLGKRVEKNVIRTAVRNGQKVMLKQAVANARSLPRAEKRLYVAGKQGEEDIRMSELMARNIVIAAPKKQIQGSYSLHVQMQRDVPQFIHRSKKGRLSYIPAAIEFGHGADPKSAARPFMRPAAENTKQQRMDRLGQELGNGILREAIKERYK